MLCVCFSFNGLWCAEMKFCEMKTNCWQSWCAPQLHFISLCLLVSLSAEWMSSILTSRITLRRNTLNIIIVSDWCICGWSVCDTLFCFVFSLESSFTVVPLWVDPLHPLSLGDNWDRGGLSLCLSTSSLILLMLRSSACHHVTKLSISPKGVPVVCDITMFFWRDVLKLYNSLSSSSLTENIKIWI